MHKPIALDISTLPASIAALAKDAPLLDYTCNTRAKTIYIERGCGYFLKIGPTGSLRQEAEMTRFFNKSGVAAEVLTYESCDNDYLLTAKIPGEIGCSDAHLSQPKKLCRVYAESLRHLHETNPAGCPYTNVTSAMRVPAYNNYRANKQDAWMLYLTDLATPQDAFTFLQQHADALVEDVPLHGDACLPNILLEEFAFRGFLDFEGGGTGDRHFDLLWAVWSLDFNLKTREYTEYFLDAYGRDVYDHTRFQLCCTLQAFTWQD